METPATNPGGSGNPSPPSNTSCRTTVETQNTDQNAAVAEPSAKRQRGRPTGSKNKPKAATLISVYPNDSLRIRLVEVASGADVASYLYAYARDRRTSLAVLHAVGCISGCVSFSHTGPIKAHRFDIISLRGTIVPDESIGAPSGLSLVVSTGHGMSERGGVVNGPMVAAGPVFVTVGSFSVSTIERLPFELLGDIRVSDPGSGSGSGYNRVYSNMNMGMANYPGGGHNGNLQYASFQSQQQNGGRSQILSADE